MLKVLNKLIRPLLNISNSSVYLFLLVVQLLLSKSLFFCFSSCHLYFVFLILFSFILYLSLRLLSLTHPFLFSPDFFSILSVHSSAKEESRRIMKHFPLNLNIISKLVYKF